MYCNMILSHVWDFVLCRAVSCAQDKRMLHADGVTAVKQACYCMRPHASV
jgi:hypothetical protein